MTTNPKGGRNPLPPEERKLNVTICMTRDELALLERIGGGMRQAGFRRMLAAWKEKKGGKGVGEHTKEPWYSGACVVWAKDGDIVCDLVAHTHPRRPDVTEANVDRIVACVNACSGMIDPVSEIAAMRSTLSGKHS